MDALDGVDSGSEKVRLLACAMTTVLCCNFNSSDAARNAFEHFCAQITGAVNSAHETHLTSWMTDQKGH